MVRNRPAANGLQVPVNLVSVGKITTVHGVKGWVKIHSFTAPESNIFDYRPWWVVMPDGERQLEVDHFRATTKGFIAHIVGLDDREEARLYCQREIRVSSDSFPQADDGDFYWHQLEGLRVISTFNGQQTDLGVVDGFMETGANDVLVVSGDSQSRDRRERLIPYVGDFVGEVDLAAGTLEVFWDPDFE